MAKGKLSAVGLFEEIQSEILQNQMRPIYLLYGEESYLPNQLQKTLVNHGLSPEDRDFNLDIIQGDETTAQSALTICQTAPMMAERRIVVIRGFDRMKHNKLFASLAKQPNLTAVVLLICEGKPRFNMAPYNALKNNRKAVKVAEFPRLWRNQATKFARDYTVKHGYKLESGVDSMLTEFLGVSLDLIVNEIEKLMTYVGDREEKIITKQDVFKASGQTREINVFELQDAIAQRRGVDAHRISEQLLSGASSRPGEALRIVAILTRYFVQLWKLHELRNERLDRSTIASKLGVPSHKLTSYYDAIVIWPLRDIQRALQLLLSVDCEIKGMSKRSPRVIMTLLMTQLLSESLSRTKALT